jgi:hypothetical protein
MIHLGAAVALPPGLGRGVIEGTGLVALGTGLPIGDTPGTVSGLFPGTVGLLRGTVGGLFAGTVGLLPGTVGGLLLGTVSGLFPGTVGLLPGTVGGLFRGRVGLLPGTVGGLFRGRVGLLPGTVGGLFLGTVGLLPGTVGGLFPGTLGLLGWLAPGFVLVCAIASDKATRHVAIMPKYPIGFIGPLFDSRFDASPVDRSPEYSGRQKYFRLSLLVWMQIS